MLDGLPLVNASELLKLSDTIDKRREGS